MSTTQFSELIETVVDGKPAELGARETLCSLLGLPAGPVPYTEMMAAARKRLASLEDDVFSDRIELRTIHIAMRRACESQFAPLPG